MEFTKGQAVSASANASGYLEDVIQEALLQAYGGHGFAERLNQLSHGLRTQQHQQQPTQDVQHQEPEQDEPRHEQNSTGNFEADGDDVVNKLDLVKNPCFSNHNRPFPIDS